MWMIKWNSRLCLDELEHEFPILPQILHCHPYFSWWPLKSQWWQRQFFFSVVGRRILRWSDLKSCVSFAFVINHPFLSFYKISHRSLLFLRQKCLSTQLHTGCAPAPKAMSTTTPSFSEHQHFTFIIVFSIWIRHFHELVLIGISFCPHSYLKLDIKWCNYVFREDINEKNVFFRALPEWGGVYIARIWIA